MAVDGPGHLAVVDRHHRLAQHALDRDDGLGEPDVGQLRRPGHDVAHGPDAVDAGALVLVGHDEAALVDLDADPVGHQPFGAGAPAHRHHDGLDVAGLVARLHRRDGAVARRRVPLDLDAGDDVDAPLLEGAGDQADDVVVAAGEDGVERLEDR